MNKPTLLLVLSFLLASCQSNNPRQSVLDKSKAAIDKICSCKNSEGQTVNDFSANEMTGMGLTQDEYIDHILTLDENADFYGDKAFKDNFADDIEYLKELRGLAPVIEKLNNEYNLDPVEEKEFTLYINEHHPFCAHYLATILALMDRFNN